MDWHLVSYGLTVHGGGMFVIPLVLGQTSYQTTDGISIVSLGILAAFLAIGLALEIAGFFRKEAVTEGQAKGMVIEGLVVALILLVILWPSIWFSGPPLEGYELLQGIIYGVAFLSSTIVVLTSLRLRVTNSKRGARGDGTIMQLD